MKTMTSCVLSVAVLASLANVVLTKPVNTGDVGAAMSRLQAWNGFVSQLEMLQTAIPERLYSKLVADLLQALARADTDALQNLLQATSTDSATGGIEGQGRRGGVDLLAALDNFLQTKRSAHRRKHHTLPTADEETAEVVGMYEGLRSGSDEDRIQSEAEREQGGANPHGRTKRMVEVLLSGDREREAARQEETEVERMIRRLVAEASGMILYTLMSDSLAELQPGQS
ncbi:PREDICTED: uncharacterized protein LOC109475546 isoform X1 [Branchiostoma belcheri]|uniref:Uncharacterized protein LOC109475546 isoform X1 n=1 Tax=Branchiostoma belcheri TaxID=7741 RepID=A0A6P4Z587_BRABE|nr:PREDICTED: uncharacterized protein LOC109475546 isoform X1 [Branchiostoma belcheri]